MLATQVAFVACAPEPSRAPLGGSYALPEASASPKPKPATTAAAEATSAEETASSSAAPSSSAPSASSSATPIAPPTEDAGTLHYEPLKTGERVQIDFHIALSASMAGMPSDFGGGPMKIDAKAKVELKVVKASPLELEQLEVTVTPEAMHSEINGQGTDSPQDPPSIYDVTASGSAPKISPRSGKLEKEDRFALLIFLAPLLEYQHRWGASPKLGPSAGYHASIPLKVPAFMTEASDTTKVGPLAVRYDGPRTSERTPFELTLPLEVSSDFGKFSLELAGKSELDARARPITLELAGPFRGNVDPNDSVTISGDAKLDAKLSYQ